MKDRGKAVETYTNVALFPDHYTSSDLPCRKHPQSSSVGVCAYCLKDRLLNLVCSDCGEQRLSSCSCSDISSNSAGTDVGRSEHEQVVLLKRSSSSCAEEIKKSGFWRIERLFMKNRDKGCRDFNFTAGEDSAGFIELKFDFPSEKKSDFSHLSDSRSAFGSMEGGVFNRGGSCRITVKEKGIRKGGKILEGWRWIFKVNSSWRNVKKKGKDVGFNFNL